METWLAARGSEALASAWAALGPTSVWVAGASGWSTCAEGLAEFAAAFLGWPVEKVAWIANESDKLPEPTATYSGSISRSVIDGHDVCAQECNEAWKIRETREGDRGIQLVRVECYYDDGTREGGGSNMTFFRAFAGDRAMSVAVGWNEVFTIGAVDLGPLDLFQRYVSVTMPWPRVDAEGVRAIIGQLGDEIGPMFDTSMDWPARTLDHNDFATTTRYERGDLAIEIESIQYADESRRVDANVIGLPWGHKVNLFVTDNAGKSYATVNLRLPLAIGEAVVARLMRVPGVEANG